MGSGQRVVSEDMGEICHMRRARPRIWETCSVQLHAGVPDVEYLLALPPAVTLSLVVSLDGQLCGPDGSSRSISGTEDLDWLRRLRGACDAVVVGAATAQREQYQPIRARPEFSAARARHGLAEHPELVLVRSSDDLAAVLRGAGPRVLLEAGVRLHTAAATFIDRLWISHSPTVVGDHRASFSLPLREYALTERWCGTEFVFSRWDRVSRH